MLDKIRAALGFLGGLAGHLPKLLGVVEMLGSIIRVNMSKNDVAPVRDACVAWFAASNELRKLLDEADQVFLAAEAAVSADGTGGDDITFDEIMAFLDEAQDVPASVMSAGKALDEVLDRLRKIGG